MSDDDTENRPTEQQNPHGEAPPAGPGTGAPAPLIVGIGASAGGLEAFRVFFAAMPADSGMAFVLVQHLDPDHASALVSLLGAVTAMPISQAESGDVVAPDRIFVIPPDAVLRIAGGVLNVIRPAAAAARRASVNAFFESLAEDQGENAVGVILSGFGSDGAAGVAAIKEHGGLTLTQAEFDHSPKPGMPQNATATGLVDHVLPVGEMPAALIAHRRYRARTDGAKGPDGVRQDVGDHLGAICAVLNGRLGRDFSQYKTNTLMRRVQRRMQVLQCETIQAYLGVLRERPDEPELLFREVLIRVTRFFRDPSAFEALADRIAAMLAAREARDGVRVWVPGCASGEEAYSLAILFKEAQARADRPRKVQIFATDIDDQAVQVARAGLYPDTIAADIPPALLDRHFAREVGGYRVSKDLREICLFSTHDLVKDAPFSRLDLISCRNLLIYFGPTLQKRVIALFHYGLQPGGLLFLGSSEAVSAHGALFSPLDKKHRLFARRAAPTQLQAIASRRSSPPAPPPAAAVDPAEREIDPRIGRVMARYSPAFVVIDRRQAVQQLSGPIGKYLGPVSGAVSLNLAVLLHPDLRAPLRAALKKVEASGARVIDPGLTVAIGERREAVDLIVEPLDPPSGAGEGLLLVAFQDRGPVRTARDGAGAPIDGEASQAMEALLSAQERLQTLSEELETSNEELQSSNEEYQSVNEELQSTNEELETSKEELQSINEELATLNSELSARNESLVELNSDLTNLFDSTSIATLFLDQDLRIRRFTPPVLDIFKVREGDEGRPITDIVSRLARDGLEADARRVLRTLVPVEREVSLASGERAYQLQIRPYRGGNNVINGVVVTFVDISERKLAEGDRAALAAIVASSRDAIIGHDLAGVITSWNAGAEALYGWAAPQAIGRSASALLNSPDRADEEAALLAQLRDGRGVADYETVQRRKDGGLIEVELSLSPIVDGDGAIIGVARIARDVSKRVAAEKEKTLLLGELDHRVKNILAVVSSVVSQTLQGAATPADFAASLAGRIQALSRAHGALTEAGPDQTRLASLVRTELAPYDDGVGRVTIGGPPIALTPRASLALAMVVHEMTTNAAKYGALSTPGGRLRVAWEIRGEAAAPVLRIVWTETGGPTVVPPSRRGFGSTLIERSLAYEFDATIDQAFPPSGLTCVMDIPFTEDLGHLAPAPTEPAPG